MLFSLKGVCRREARVLVVESQGGKDHREYGERVSERAFPQPRDFI